MDFHYFFLRSSNSDGLKILFINLADFFNLFYILLNFFYFIFNLIQVYSYFRLEEKPEKFRSFCWLFCRLVALIYVFVEARKSVLVAAATLNYFLHNCAVVKYAGMLISRTHLIITNNLVDNKHLHAHTHELTLICKNNKLLHTRLLTRT